MELQEVKAINGVLHYYHNGRWFPVKIVGMGAGGTRRITNNTISGGDTIESGTFTLSADGMEYTSSPGGVILTNPGTNPTLTIPTIKKAKLIFFNTVTTSGFPIIVSDGRTDGSINNNIHNTDSGIVTSYQDNSIDTSKASGLGEIATRGSVFVIGSNSFDIIFALIGPGGIGLPIRVQWHAITG